jgi:hypothetical protein
VPLVKKRPQPGREPDVRPVALAEVLLRAVHRALNDAVAPVVAPELAPQQVSIGVSNGIAILVHGVRMLLECKRDMVVVKIDLDNAHNAYSRSVSLRRMAAIPSLQHIVPFLHALGAAPSDLFVGGERLFDGARGAHGDSSTGGQQGLSLTALAFCIILHPFVY